MVQRKDVRDSIEKYVKNRLPIDKDDLVLWVGSTATGLSNYYSDIDLIVVTPAVDRYPSNVFDGEVNIIAEIYDDYRFDVEIRSLESIMNIRSKLESFQVNRESHDMCLSETQLCLICDLLNSEVIIGNNVWVNKIIKSPILIEKICDCIRFRYEGLYYNQLEDIRGFITSKKYYNVCFMIPRLVTSVMILYAASMKLPFVKEKWVLDWIIMYSNDKEEDVIFLKEIMRFDFDPEQPNMSDFNSLIRQVSRLMDRINNK